MSTQWSNKCNERERVERRLLDLYLMHHEPIQHLCVLLFHSNAIARSLKEQETLLGRLSLEATRSSLTHLRRRGSHFHGIWDRDPRRALSFASRVPAPEMTKHCKQLNRAAFGREAMGVWLQTRLFAPKFYVSSSGRGV